VTKVWRQSVNRYWRYRGNIKLPRESRTDGRTDARTDGQRHGRTTRKHIASAGAYRRRRLKKFPFPSFSRAINLLLRRCTQQKVNVVMTCIKGHFTTTPAIMILFTQSTAVLHKYLNDKLQILSLLQFFPGLHRIPWAFLEFSMFREIAECSRFSRFVATLYSTMLIYGVNKDRQQKTRLVAVCCRHSIAPISSCVQKNRLTPCHTFQHLTITTNHTEGYICSRCNVSRVSTGYACNLGVKNDWSGVASLLTVDGNFVTQLNPRHSKNGPSKHRRKWKFVIFRGVARTSWWQQP